MAIILEGSDCTGKTTFAEKLSEVTGFKIVKGSSFEISELGADGMFEHMLGLLNREDIIIDRFLYSNLVYGELFNYPMMTPTQYDSLVERLDETSLLVYLHASIGTIKYRMNNRGDDMIKVENIEDIVNKYNEVLYGDFRPSTMVSLETTLSNADGEANMIKMMYKGKYINS